MNTSLPVNTISIRQSFFGVAICVLCLMAALSWWAFDNHAQTIARSDRQQFDRALIATIYGSQYRNLSPTPERSPLRTLHNRYPALIISKRLDSTFANNGNGYVLLMWVEALPERRRQDFLYGLDLVIDDAQRRGGDLAEAINFFRENYQADILVMRR